MPDNFNPYAEWLGLADTLISPNHYELLGIDSIDILMAELQALLNQISGEA